MSKKNYYLFSSGELKRENNSLRLDTGDDFKRIPIETVESIYCFGQITYNTKLCEFLNENTVSLHIFGWNNQYAGSYIPKKKVKSGETVVKQVEAYNHPARRKVISREIISGSIHNMNSNLKYYNNRNRDFNEQINKMENLKENIPDTSDLEKLMGHEATARKVYYSCFEEILKPSKLEFKKREYNPPSSEVNSLISFLNSLVYTNIVSAIRKTALDPSIGYLHKPGNRRYTLSLDIADIFKPVLADRCMFRLANRKQITEESFKNNSTYRLKDKSRKTVLKEYENIIQDTIEHPELNRHVSFKTLLKLESYKIKKYILYGEKYKSFKRWW